MALGKILRFSLLISVEESSCFCWLPPCRENFVSLQTRMGPFTNSALVTSRILKTLSIAFSRIKYKIQPYCFPFKGV